MQAIIKQWRNINEITWGVVSFSQEYYYPLNILGTKDVK